MEGPARESLSPLLDLQRVDSGLDRANERRSNLPEQRELDELLSRSAEAEALHVERSAELADRALEQSKLEGEIQMLQDKISHESDRLYGGSIANPKELASIQAELDALRRRKSYIEDQVLDVLERRETVEADVASRATELAEISRLVEDATARRDAASSEIVSEIQALEQRRSEILEVVAPEIMDLYEGLRKRKDGLAAAALEDGMCRGCNVRLSTVALNAIKQSDDPVIRCENCRRILVPQ